MSLSNISLPKPKNWQDFESRTRVLFACVLNNPKPNRMVDRVKSSMALIFTVREQRLDCLVGVQCKKKFEAAVTEKNFVLK